MNEKLFVPIIRRYRYLPGLLFFGLMSMIACDDIFLQDISNDDLFLLTPGDSVTITRDSAIVFNWDHLPDATGYQIQVVSPDFENATNLFLDSATNDNTVSLFLADGEYTWGVRAFNSAYSTDYFIRSFTVDRSETSPDISESKISLLVPNGAQQSAEVIFGWNEIAEATAYRIQVVTPDFITPRFLLLDTLISSSQKLSAGFQSGDYTWRIKAVNASSETDFFTATFSIPEGVVQQQFRTLKPADGYRANGSGIELNWESVKDADFYVVNIPAHSQQQHVVETNRYKLDLTDEEGLYSWNVTAVIEKEGNIASDTSNFNVLPGIAAAPELQLPSEGETFTDRVDFSWLRSVDTILGDSLFIYNEEDELAEGFPVYTENAEYKGFTASPGTYKWSVKSIDFDGNEGESAVSGSFIIE